MKDPRVGTAIGIFGAVAILAGAATVGAAVDQARIAPALDQARTDANAVSPDPTAEDLEKALATRDDYLSVRLRRPIQFQPRRDANEALRPDVLSAEEILAQHNAHVSKFESIATSRGNLRLRNALAETWMFPGLVTTLVAAELALRIGFEQRVRLAFSIRGQKPSAI